jgi:hypothetical protein
MEGYTLLLLIFMGFLFLFSIQIPISYSQQIEKDVPGSQIPEWVFIIYMDADNNLESAGIDDINEMETVGSNLNINIIVQIDRADGYDNSNGDWKGVRRYFITKDYDTDTISSNLLQDLGELDMANPDTLSNFVIWAINNNPAKKYALVLWNHGSGWKRVNINTMEACDGCDATLGLPWEESKSIETEEIKKPIKGLISDDYSGSIMSLQELEQALNTIKTNTGVTLDIIGFDACLMQMVEVEYEINPYANVGVGSEEVEPGDGWPYDNILTDLIANPTWNAVDLGDNIVNNYMNFYGYSSSQTQSAIYQSQLTDLINSIDNFAQVLYGSLLSNKDEIKTARELSQSYFYPEYIDLYHFAELVKTYVTDTEVKNAATEVMNNVNNVVFSEGHGSLKSNSHGLTIYFPSTKTDLKTYKTLEFAQNTHWDEFLIGYYSNPSIIVPGTRILIVDDSKNKYTDYYKDALGYYGFKFSYWSVETDGSPNLTLLSDYDLVMWFTGDEYANTLTTLDQTNIASYMNAGGNLFLSGQDIGYDIGLSSFYSDYLHADFVSDYVNDDLVNGVSGDPISNGLTLNLSDGNGANNNNYPSSINTLSGATPIFYYGIGSLAGLKYEGAYKLVYIAFPFESINDDHLRSSLIYRIINWIDPTLTDFNPPHPYRLLVNLGDDQPNGTITIQTRISEENEIISVVVQIESPDENVIENITLYDDGTHGDKDPNDNIYGNRWITLNENDYFVDFITKDSVGNIGKFDNLLRFSTKKFNKQQKILLVYDDPYNRGYETYYINALIDNGFGFDYYNVYENGSPYTSLLLKYRDGSIIWALPNDKGPDEFSQINLISYLDSGGKLFITGQDVGWYIFTFTGYSPNAFYNDYLHAKYIQDNIGYWGLEGVSGDSITNGLNLKISGFGGADNQYYPSEIDPLGEAIPIFTYSTKNEGPKSPRADKSSKFIDSLRKNESKIILSSGTSGLRVDTGTYKVVYLSFGFEGINDPYDRSILLKRILNWFNITTNVEGRLTYLENKVDNLSKLEERISTLELWTNKTKNAVCRIFNHLSLINPFWECQGSTSTTTTTTPTTSTTTTQPGCNVLCNKQTTNCQTSCNKCPSTGYKNCQYEWISRCGNSTGYINPGQLIPNLRCTYTSTCILRGCS